MRELGVVLLLIAAAVLTLDDSPALVPGCTTDLQCEMMFGTDD